MKLKKNASKLKIQYRNTNPMFVNALLGMLKGTGVAIYENSKEFDPEYPVVGWDGYQVSQFMSTLDSFKVVDTMEEFINELFISDTIEMKLTDDYDATVTADIVRVGCQSIPYDKVKELYDAMTSLRD